MGDNLETQVGDSWERVEGALRADESGDTTPCRVAVVTLQSHVRYKEIETRT